jgi:hypothetical protein
LEREKMAAAGLESRHVRAEKTTFECRGNHFSAVGRRGQLVSKCSHSQIE